MASPEERLSPKQQSSRSVRDAAVGGAAEFIEGSRFKGCMSLHFRRLPGSLPEHQRFAILCRELAFGVAASQFWLLLKYRRCH